MYLYFYNNENLMCSSTPIVSDLHKEITREEYDKIADELGRPHYISPEEELQQQIIQRQAELMELRAQEPAAWIDEELEAIADYWDSLDNKEGQVATYGTN